MPTITVAEEGNWRMGRVYYRMVCTDCHKKEAGGAISPATNTKAEWNEYIWADKHANGQSSLMHYVSTEFRDTIKARSKIVSNKKFVAKSTKELLADVHAFVIYGAKDSETPARCN